MALIQDDTEWDELRYHELGPEGTRVGWLGVECHNGTMSERQCLLLCDALQWVRPHPTQVLARRWALVDEPDQAQRIKTKQAQREHDEMRKPLATYRNEELTRMTRNFYGFDPSYHVAQHHFVFRKPHAWTPRHLALHRELAPAFTPPKPT